MDAGLQHRSKTRRFIYNADVDYLGRLMRAGGMNDMDISADDVVKEVRRQVQRSVSGAKKRVAKDDAPVIKGADDYDDDDDDEDDDEKGDPAPTTMDVDEDDE